MSEPIITAHLADAELHRLETYKTHGGYEGLTKALSEYTPAQVIDYVKKANLRGRGGAGFPAGNKWGFVPQVEGQARYLCVNADEGEPGTFKDKVILERTPHMMLEGIVIACYAIGIHHAYIYIRGEFALGARRLQAAVDEAYAAGILGPKVMGKDFALDVTVHRGAGAYICGEETGLIESLEGKKGQPRIKPPFPAVVGVFGAPTVVNNVETLALLPPIFTRGLDWWLAIGSPKCPGTRMYCLSGQVRRPGVYELPTSTTIRTIIEEYGGGPLEGRKIKAVIPGGLSAPPLKPDQLDIAADFDSLAAAGSMGGSGGIIVIDDSQCLVRLTRRISQFFAHESCGQCTPCREGTGWLVKLLTRIETGKAAASEVATLDRVAGGMRGITICVFSDAAAMPVQGFLKHWRAEFEEHTTLGRCPMGAMEVGDAQGDH